MSYTIYDRTLALAGIFQAIKLVQQVARTGMVDYAVFEASIKSLFTLDSSSPEAVYGSSTHLRMGFETLISQLGGGPQVGDDSFNAELTKYLINVVVLEKKLSKQKSMLEKIADGIKGAQDQVSHYSYTHDNVIANLADLYTSTLSTLKPRIIVNGEHNHLANSNNANKIRALLLAAVRSAVLWRQCGGSRWQILFQRKAILKSAEAMMKEIREQQTLH